MRTVQLVGQKAAGRVARIDDGDYELVTRYRWRVIESREADRPVKGPYAMATFYEARRRVDILMHTLITGWPMVDHANGNGLDNQRSNLRPTTTAQNNHNQRPRFGTSSRYKGVTWHKRARKWQASIKVDDRSHYLGLFASEEEAAAAYAAAALKIQGEYAYVARGAA